MGKQRCRRVKFIAAAIDWGSYHEGELTVQRRAGVGREGLQAGEMYHAAMPAGVRKFLPRQNLAVMATIDRDGWLWAPYALGRRVFCR